MSLIVGFRYVTGQRSKMRQVGEERPVDEVIIDTGPETTGQDRQRRPRKPYDSGV